MQMSQEGLTLASDCDGVLYRWARIMRHWLSTECGIPVDRLTAPTTYSVLETWGITPEYLLAEMTKAVQAGVLFWTGDIYDDGAAALQDIATAGHRIVVLTARDLPGIEALCKEATETWLTQAGMPFHDVVLSSRKHEMDFDLLVDDCPANVRTALAAGRRAVLLDRPWNRDATDLPVTTWAGVPALLN